MEDIKNLKDEISNQISNHTAKMTKFLEDVTTAVHGFGTWCAEKGGPLPTLGTITYDSITYSDSNMNITDTPLNITTGINIHKC